MKNSIIIDLIKGLIDKTPKRIVWFRNICIVLAAIVASILFMQNNHLLELPTWIANLIDTNGLIGMLIAAGIGSQLAKKDINEGK